MDIRCVKYKLFSYPPPPPPTHKKKARIPYMHVFVFCFNLIFFGSCKLQDDLCSSYCPLSKNRFKFYELAHWQFTDYSKNQPHQSYSDSVVFEKKRNVYIHICIISIISKNKRRVTLESLRKMTDILTKYKFSNLTIMIIVIVKLQ